MFDNIQLTPILFSGLAICCLFWIYVVVRLVTLHRVNSMTLRILGAELTIRPRGSATRRSDVHEKQ